jgi:para-nitrobenzyl esterase
MAPTKALAAFLVCAAGQPSVDVAGLGSLIGFESSRYGGVAQFFGVPFGKPPVGELRWQPPVPHGAWQSPRDATKYGNSCMQPDGLHSQPISEDCLYLNIATPKAQLDSAQKLPIMFWIYGGAYTQGEAATYPIDALVSTSGNRVVVAAGNYRLGLLGFLASADVQARSSDGSAGNFGLQDQRLGMMWMRDHGAAFGGDGSKMTIFGESAGGNSVMNHLVLPASGNLFQRAIVESGTYNSGARGLSAAEDDYQKFLKDAGCQDLDCLVGLDAETVKAHWPHVLAYPVVDGVEFTASAGELIAQGQYHSDVDVLLGSNRDELALFIGDILPKNLNNVEFQAALELLLPNPFQHAAAQRIYESDDYKYPDDLAGRSQKWWEMVRMGTDAAGLGGFTDHDDGVFALGHCGARHVAQMLKAGGTSVVYGYLFASGTVVQHGDDIGYAFGDVESFKSQSDKDLAKTMGTFWSNFAVDGNPNGAGLPQWPEFDIASDKVLRFDNGSSIFVEERLRAEACAFWKDHVVHIDPNNLLFIGSSVLPPAYIMERIAEADILV